jgi:hypothetical protein
MIPILDGSDDILLFFRDSHGDWNRVIVKIPTSRIVEIQFGNQLQSNSEKSKLPYRGGDFHGNQNGMSVHVKILLIQIGWNFEMFQMSR